MTSTTPTIRPGQTLRLAEFIPRPAEEYPGDIFTDRWVLALVTHIERAPAFGVPEGYVVMSITVTARSDEQPPPRYLEIASLEERIPSFA